MAAWPFAMKERQQEAKRLMRARRIKEMEQRMNEGVQRGLNIREICAHFDQDRDEEPVVWYPWGHDHLQDALACDDDLLNAVRRIPQGIIRRLVVCSSRLTAAGICQTLQIHVPDLRVLRLWEPRVTRRSEFVLDIVRRCSELRHIDTFNCELQVSHEMLACLMMCTPHLERFSGNRRGLGLFQEIHPQDTVIFPFPEGEQRVAAESLTLDAIEAFKRHFPAADIFVDWYEMGNLMDAMEQVLAG